MKSKLKCCQVLCVYCTYSSVCWVKKVKILRNQMGPTLWVLAGGICYALCWIHWLSFKALLKLICSLFSMFYMNISCIGLLKAICSLFSMFYMNISCIGLLTIILVYTVIVTTVYCFLVVYQYYMHVLFILRNIFYSNYLPIIYYI